MKHEDKREQQMQELERKWSQELSFSPNIYSYRKMSSPERASKTIDVSEKYAPKSLTK